MHNDWFLLPEFAWNWAIMGLFALVVLVQLFYFWFYFSRAAFYRPGQKEGFVGPVSVVICARNEFHNLEKNLPLVLQQDFPEFEVVVVDDGSDDDSDVLLQQLQSDYKHLKVVRLKENVNFFKGKKLALSVGIKSAKNDTILLTDADCRPASPHWITRMADNFGGSTGIVLGYGGYECRPGFLNRMIRFDTFFIALQYFGFALAGRAYMGVGRNLSYQRALFYQAKGFTSHYKIMSGDDDLFINQVATPGNVAIELHPHSHTISVPKTSFRDWFRQKKRHLSTARHYKKGHKRRLGIFWFSQTVYYPLLALSLVYAGESLFGILVAGLFLLRTFSVLLIFFRFGKNLREERMFPVSLLFDIMYPLFNLIFVVLSQFGPTKRWK